MRKKNSNCEFSSQRSMALIQNFRESLARQSKISAAIAFKDAVEAPAPRFWVTEARATRVIALLMKGIDATEGMLPEKKKMYLEIFSRVKEIHNLNPEIPLGDIVFDVVNSPAPCSYLSPDRASRIIYGNKHQRRVK